ncbi:hypothetical protein Tco_1531840 [Tanacetum coccineum]
MAQPQRPADVHQDELCPPNKRYALMDANKKVDLENPLCLDESRILANILQNHPQRFSIAASSSVPWIYLGQIIFDLPQATNNNHDHFVPASNSQKWFHSASTILIMQMLYCFISNIHVDYAELLWEGFHYSLTNPTTMIPYPRFTKLIVSHYMTTFPEISRRTRDRYHNLADNVMIKSIFNSGKSKGVVGMKIPNWMITEEMKPTKNYRLYAEVFGVDVPTTQSQPIESTQETHTTTSAPRTPNPKIGEGESSASRKSTIIRLRDLVLQDTLQVSLAEQKSREELETKQNMEKVKEHLMAEEIKKLVEGSENVEEDVEVSSSPLRNDDNQTNPGTRLEPRSDKEIPEVEKIADISQPVNVIEDEEESTEDDYELKRREKGKEIEESRNTPSPTTTRYLISL